MYLTLSQASKELDRTERQVRYLIKIGVLSPANQDTFRRDGGYRFSEDEVKRAKEKLKLEGISLRKAAQIVGVTPQYLNSLALAEKIDSKLVQIGNKTERRFNEKDCIDFKEHLHTRTHKSIAKYGEKLHLYKNRMRLFDLIPYHDETVRIVNTSTITLLKADGGLIHPDEQEILLTSDEWPHKPYNPKKGFIVFRLPIPRKSEHITYDLLYELISELGPKNIQVFERAEGDYLVRCRQARVKLNKEYFDLLQRYVIEGEIHYLNGEVKLESGIVSQYIHLPNELHAEVEKLANLRSMTTQEQLIEAVVRGVKSIQKEGF
ncbi:MerR family transcriptional regulator [Robertmurraya yapensis]|uniref:MerR family transcriptional regulator n=2 Tax=Bacillaceae TaxID=186817 RepID=A0A3S0KAT2_9BACI|nr:MULTISPECIES: MerR family transcriptional regulator [Bacillaceae]RTR26563.1 MerR family transcriptional regulator [Bacillus yapensis]TKC15058.1 MerR family transcriptional regulator [Robertmurraya kyonggiensis]TKS93738.1 MerR family transcriptional regulator [Bacillus yapensis]